jgi:hypothetical protein
MEKWKDIKNYEGLYQVSNMGRIKSLARKRNGGKAGHGEIILKFGLAAGYSRVSLYRDGNQKQFSVHRLVLDAFCGESNLQCNHRNGLKTDNRLINLEWVTPSENTKHAISTGLQIIMKGSQLPQSKLTESQVRRIKFIYKNTKPEINYITKLAKALKVNHHTISDIILEKAWSHIKI